MNQISRYESLQIYKSALDLVIKLDVVVRTFPQFHKYVMGTRLRDKALAILFLIPAVSYKESRGQKLVELCIQAEELKLLCNVAKEVQAFKSFEQFRQIMEQVMHVARQAEGWRRSLQSKGPESPKGSVPT